LNLNHPVQEVVYRTMATISPITTNVVGLPAVLPSDPEAVPPNDMEVVPPNDPEEV
jgi:hypothetical protein